MKILPRSPLSTVTLLLLTPTALADIESTCGSVVEIPAPPSVELGALESSQFIHAFDEAQGVLLMAPVAVDLCSPGLYDECSDLQPGTLPAGTLVNSHLVHMDPDGGEVLTLSGCITFEEEILGVMVLTPTLDVSDALLGSPGTIYPGNVFRGLELDTNPDELIIDLLDTRTIQVQLFTAQNIDQLRVLTDAGTTPISTFCFGDGSGAACPCGNESVPGGGGCANGTFPEGATLTGSGTPSVSNDSLQLTVTFSTPGQPGLFFQGDLPQACGRGIPFGDGLRCAGTNVVRLQSTTANGSGSASTSGMLSVSGGVLPGQSKRYQWWYRDPMGTPCGSGFNLSNGVRVVWGL